MGNQFNWILLQCAGGCLGRLCIARNTSSKMDSLLLAFCFVRCPWHPLSNLLCSCLLLFFVIGVFYHACAVEWTKYGCLVDTVSLT